MNTDTLVEWQIRSPKNGMVMAWWTHPILEFIEKCNWKDKVILETGAGRGTAWLRERCKWVDSIEADLQWAAQVQKDCDEFGLINGRVFAAQLPDGVQERKQEYFDLIPNDKQYDIISVDGIWRFEMLQWALEHFKGHGGLLIADNFDQDFVWISPVADSLMLPYKDVEEIFYQPNHTNHNGKQWNTRLWNIPA